MNSGILWDLSLTRCACVRPFLLRSVASSFPSCSSFVNWEEIARHFLTGISLYQSVSLYLYILYNYRLKIFSEIFQICFFNSLIVLSVTLASYIPPNTLSRLYSLLILFIIILLLYFDFSLSVTYMLYCDENYYGASCSVYCVPEDSNSTGHYTCDPDTGEKICRTGTTDTTRASHCTSFPNPFALLLDLFWDRSVVLDDMAFQMLLHMPFKDNLITMEYWI